MTDIVMDHLLVMVPANLISPPVYNQLVDALRDQAELVAGPGRRVQMEVVQVTNWWVAQSLTIYSTPTPPDKGKMQRFREFQNGYWSLMDKFHPMISHDCGFHVIIA